MAKPADKEALQTYREVLLEFGGFKDYVIWRPRAFGWVSAELDGMTAKYFVELMQDFVRRGGEIDQVIETREDYVYYRFHYDLRMPVSGRSLYVETAFEHKPDIEDCTIIIVNVKDK